MIRNKTTKLAEIINNNGRYSTKLEAASFGGSVNESNGTEAIETEKYRKIDKGQFGENNSHRDKQCQTEWRTEVRQQKDYSNDKHDQNRHEGREDASPAILPSSHAMPQMFVNFIDNEKKRMQNVIQYEQSRMKEIESFLAKEKLRLKNLERFEKEILSNALIDEALKKLSSSFTPVLERQHRDYKVGYGWTKHFVPNQMKVDDQSYEIESDHVYDYGYIYQPTTLRLSPFTERPPSMIICFLGGAGIGEFPHILYSTFLRSISEKLNATIITVPYRIQLNHHELSRQTNDLFERAIASYEEKLYHLSSKRGHQQNYEEYDNEGNEVKMIKMKDRVQKKKLPLYFLGHSLGSKLLSLSLAELSCGENKKDTGMNHSDTNRDENSTQYLNCENIAGVGFIAYNNFGFRDTTKQIKLFSSSLFNHQHTDQHSETVKMQTPEQELQHRRLGLDSIIEFTEQAMSMTGLEFSPSPSDTNEILSTKYRQKKALLRKTRLFVFDEDQLHSTEAIVEAMDDTMEYVSVSGLPGSHLSPVFLDFLDLDLMTSDDVNLNRFNKIAKVLKDVVLIDGIQGLSYGDEDSLSFLIEEVCEWVQGKSPRRGPSN